VHLHRTGERGGAEDSGFPWVPVGGGLAGALLVGIAITAASPGRRRPALVRERIAAWRAWGVPVWEVAWCADLLAVDEAGAVGRPPSVDALRSDLIARLDALVGA
jgi:hypothetical protein